MLLIKLPLLPVMFVFEVLLMFICLVMGVMKINPDLALRVIQWSERLPEFKWYYT